MNKKISKNLGDKNIQEDMQKIMQIITAPGGIEVGQFIEILNQFADVLSNCDKIEIPRFVKILTVSTDVDEIKIELKMLRDIPKAIPKQDK